MPSSYFDDPKVANGKCFSNSFAFSHLLLPLLLEVFASVLGSTLCVRAQVTELSAHPQLADSYLCRPYMPACLPFCMSVCIGSSMGVCGCAMWLNTFCSINKPRRGSQLASAHFSVRHVSNLLRKIFFNLAIGSRSAPFSIDPWHAWHLASGTCWRHISVHDWRQSVCAL